MKVYNGYDVLESEHKEVYRLIMSKVREKFSVKDIMFFASKIGFIGEKLNYRVTLYESDISKIYDPYSPNESNWNEYKTYLAVVEDRFKEEDKIFVINNVFTVEEKVVDCKTVDAKITKTLYDAYDAISFAERLEKIEERLDKLQFKMDTRL